MTSALLADAVVTLHLLFIVFACLGGLLVLRWARLAWLHLPAVVWGVWIELSGGICPLTPLENSLRAAAGQAGYNGGFINHYLLPIIYPAGLTHNTQILLGAGLLVFNLCVYGWMLYRMVTNSSEPVG